LTDRQTVNKNMLRSSTRGHKVTEKKRHRKLPVRNRKRPHITKQQASSSKSSHGNKGGKQVLSLSGEEFSNTQRAVDCMQQMRQMVPWRIYIRSRTTCESELWIDQY